MEPKKTVFEGCSKIGIPFSVRYPSMSDAPALQEHFNQMSSERTFSAFQGEQISLEEENLYLEGKLLEIDAHESVLLLAFSEGRLAGMAQVAAKFGVETHVGSFGISVGRNFRGQGIGTRLAELVMREAEENIRGLRIIELNVFGDNEVAYSIYKDKLGFREFGCLPGGLSYRKGFVDLVLMYKSLTGV
jgi:RimJ/RimL family protein N-acetyltransferase